MVKNRIILERFENHQLKKSLSYKKSLKIFEELWKEAKLVGALPAKNPLDGIQKDIRIAGILNSCLKKRLRK